MTKLADTPIYSKKRSNNFSRTKRPLIIGLDMYIWGCEAYLLVQMIVLD